MKQKTDFMLIILHMLFRRISCFKGMNKTVALCLSYVHSSSFEQEEKPLLQIALVFRLKATTEEENRGHKKFLQVVDCSLDRSKASSWKARHDEF